MRILKIAFKNINSLRGEHVIDFNQEPFLQNSLFAITGPTGSGKTTILDVISLALFNQVPRLGKLSTSEVLKKGAILTRNQKEAYAQITYSCKAGTFSSTWTISTARTGNLREYYMQITDLQSSLILDLKKSEVPQKNEDLIGLNYDQFIKSVVLAQGEFAKFLKVPKKERGALLEKITGTQIYRQLGQEAYSKYKEIGREIDDKRVKIETYKEQLLEEAQFNEKEEQASKLQLQRKNLQLNIDQYTEAVRHKQKLAAERQDLKNTHQKLEASESALVSFQKDKGVQLKRHEALEVFSEDFNRWQKFQENLKERRDELRTIKTALDNLKEEQKNLQELFKSNFKLDINPDNHVEKLTTYKRKLRTLLSEKKELLLTYRTTAEHTQNLAKPFQFVSKLTELGPFKEELDNKYEDVRKRYYILSDKFRLDNNEISQLQEKTRQQLKKTRLAEKEMFQLNQLKKEWQQLTDALEKITGIKVQLPEQIQAIQQELHLKQAQLEAKEKSMEVARLKKKLEDYRKELVEDTPCPLCGALHHPYAHDEPVVENHLHAEVKELRERVAGLTKESTQKETRLNQLKEEETELTDSIAKHKQTFEEKNKIFVARFNNILPKEEQSTFSGIERALEQQLDELNEVEKLREKHIQLEQLAIQIKKLQKLIQEGKAKRDEIKISFKGNDFESEINDAESSWNRNIQAVAQNEQALAKSRQNIHTLSKDLEKLDNSLVQRLENEGYSGIDEAIAMRLKVLTAQNWQKEREHLRNKYLQLKTLEERLKKEITVQEEKERAESIEELQQTLKEYKEQRSTNETDYNQISRLIENQKEHIRQIKSLEQSVGAILKKSEHWKILNDLIGDATGNKFNDFAQDLTLAQLLQLANKRLSYLTDRYQIDQPLDEEDDSLVAVDKHMGGQRRSIKTLSGGETFILSLALALALSDLASRNIEINSLFIDEGFGTLDPETLDQTLDTLEVLQAESSKMIGVISHVESLKERIATQIQLKRNGQGYSTLQIV